MTAGAATPPGLAWWEHSRGWVIIALLLAAPFLLVSLPPVTDALGHAARYAVQLDGGRSADLARFYRFEWKLVGNLGADLLIEPFGRLLGVERGVWLIAASIPVLTGLSLLLLVRTVNDGRIPPTLPWAMLFIYSYPFSFGFLNYCLALPVALASFALWQRLEMRPAVRAPLFVALSLVTWLCHAMGWMTLALLVGGYELGRALEARPFNARHVLSGTAARVWPIAAPLLILLLTHGRYGHAPSFLVGGAPEKAMRIVTALRDQHELLDIATVAAAVAILPIAFLLGARMPLRFLLPALLCLGAFLALPTMLMGLFFADTRLAPAVLMVALALWRWPAGRPRATAWVAGIGVMLLFLRLMVTANGFVAYDRAYARHLQALDQVPRGSRIGVLTRLPCRSPTPWRTHRLEHIDGLAVVRRHAWVNSLWDASGAQPLTVRYRPGARFFHDPSQFVSVDHCPYRPALSMDRKLDQLPRDDVDYLWMIDLAPAERARRNWLTPVWSDDESALYRVQPRGRP